MDFFPDASIHADWRELLARDDVRVVDIATHVDVRPPIVEADELDVCRDNVPLPKAGRELRIALRSWRC